MQQFTVLRLFIKYGRYFALLTVLVVWAGAAWAAATLAFGWIVMITAMVVGLVLGFLVLVFVDLTRIVAEMLLPR